MKIEELEKALFLLKFAEGSVRGVSSALERDYIQRTSWGIDLDNALRNLAALKEILEEENKHQPIQLCVIAEGATSEEARALIEGLKERIRDAGGKVTVL